MKINFLQPILHQPVDPLHITLSNLTHTRATPHAKVLNIYKKNNGLCNISYKLQFVSCFASYT